MNRCFADHHAAGAPWLIFVPWRRQIAGLEQDRRVFIVVAHLGVSRRGERDHTQAERRETLSLAARLLSGLAAHLLLRLQALSATLDVG
jgi:hypothetical protein